MLLQRPWRDLRLRRGLRLVEGTRVFNQFEEELYLLASVLRRDEAQAEREKVER